MHDTRSDRRQGAARRARRRRRGARALSPRADAAARPARRRVRAAQAPRADRHLHHRSQRQLHERLRGEVQLLRVLPAGRARPRATCSASTRCSGRSTKRSPSAACSCCLQGGHNPDLPLTWYEDLFRAIKERYPAFKLHALSPPKSSIFAAVAAAGRRGARAADRRGPRQRAGRRRRDSGRSRAQAAALLRQGDRRRVARRHASRAPRRACARRRR